MSIDTEGETTGELDTASLGVLLQQDVERTLSDEPTTVTLKRDRLLELLDESSGPQLTTLAHTVRRPVTAQNTRLMAPPPELLDMKDMNIRQSLSPLVMLGVIAMLVGLFFAVMHAS